jgi:hypothetical protein
MSKHMFDILQYLKAIFTIQSKYIFGMFLFCVTLILAPQNWLKILGVDTLPTELKRLAGLIAIATFCILITRLILFMTKKYYCRCQKKAAIAKLLTLSKKEKEYLEYCIKEKQQSITTFLNDGTAQSLVQKGILEAKEGTGDLLNYPFLIPDFIWTHLNKNRKKYFSG